MGPRHRCIKGTKLSDMNFSIKPIYLLLLSALFSACTQEENSFIVNSDEVPFVATMPGVSSRAYDVAERLFNDGFTVSAFSTEKDAGADGILIPHFHNKTVSRQVDGVFRSDECKWPGNADGKIGNLKFFAFHPSIVNMKYRAGVGNECFNFLNQTTKNASSIVYDYRLTNFRVAPDISNQVDFVSAIGEGNKTAHLYSGIELEFEHQLCGVEVGVWGASSLYDVEIAGVRVGGSIVEADFSLSTEIAKPGKDDNTIGEWFFSSTPLRGHVDFVFAPGDKVVNVNVNEHNTKELATSIMGSGGKALLIPQKQDKWDYTTDKNNPDKGTYFSALIRMYQHGGDHHLIYPSTDPESADYLVYLAVNKSDGTVMKRLDKYGNVFGTNIKYEIPATEELRQYGWAAAPADVDWKAGYTYSYILDYSVGVGVHDPADPNPASPIIDYGGVEVTTTSDTWTNGGVIGKDSWGANTNNTAPDGTVWWK